MHNICYTDPEPADGNFTGKVVYETELKSSIKESNLVAYCHKCKKETITVIQMNKSKGIKYLKEMLYCCCSNWNIKSASFACSVCAEILIKSTQ